MADLALHQQQHCLLSVSGAGTLSVVDLRTRRVGQAAQNTDAQLSHQGALLCSACSACMLKRCQLLACKGVACMGRAASWVISTRKMVQGLGVSALPAAPEDLPCCFQITPLPITP